MHQHLLYLDLFFFSLFFEALTRHPLAAIGSHFSSFLLMSKRCNASEKNYTPQNPACNTVWRIRKNQNTQTENILKCETKMQVNTQIISINYVTLNVRFKYWLSNFLSSFLFLIALSSAELHQPES